jgi:hypothetical protein
MTSMLHTGALILNHDVKRKTLIFDSTPVLTVAAGGSMAIQHRPVPGT